MAEEQTGGKDPGSMPAGSEAGKPPPDKDPEVHRPSTPDNERVKPGRSEPVTKDDKPETKR